MSTPIAVTLRDRIIAPVIEDIAEMERRVLVTMFTYLFIYFWYSLQKVNIQPPTSLTLRQVSINFHLPRKPPDLF